MRPLKAIYTSPPGRPVHSDTNAASMGSIQPDAIITRRLFIHVSTTVYIKVLISTAHSACVCCVRVCTFVVCMCVCMYVLRVCVCMHDCVACDPRLRVHAWVRVCVHVCVFACSHVVYYEGITNNRRVIYNWNVIRLHSGWQVICTVISTRRILHEKLQNKT